jgi:hypothetical protein
MKILINSLLMSLLPLSLSASLSANESTYFQVASKTDLYRSCMSAAKHDCQSWAAEGGGSPGPRGLNAETRAELAQGERYILNGTIEFRDFMPYLVISFRSHPWLMSSVRLQAPYYRISDSMSRWSNHRGKEVTIIVTARYRSFQRGGRTHFEIYLEPSSDPMPAAIQSSRH